MGLTCPNARSINEAIQASARYVRFVRQRPWHAGVVSPQSRKDRYVRKYLYVAVAAASAAVLAAPIVSEAAPAAHSHVLTIRKVGGTAVKPRAVLKASLVKGTKAVFSLSGGLTATITCKQSSFTAVVVKNPLRRGKATESLTGETIGKCSGNIMGTAVNINKVTVLHLPYNSTTSDAKKFPVTISGRKKTKPIEITSVASLGNMSITCSYVAASIVGSASNKGNTITIFKQKFTRAASSNTLCPTTAKLSAKYGPVQDTSVRGKPRVFVN